MLLRAVRAGYDGFVATGTRPPHVGATDAWVRSAEAGSLQAAAPRHPRRRGSGRRPPALAAGARWARPFPPRQQAQPVVRSAATRLVSNGPVRGVPREAVLLRVKDEAVRQPRVHHRLVVRHPQRPARSARRAQRRRLVGRHEVRAGGDVRALGPAHPGEAEAGRARPSTPQYLFGGAPTVFARRAAPCGNACRHRQR